MKPFRIVWFCLWSGALFGGLSVAVFRLHGTEIGPLGFVAIPPFAIALGLAVPIGLVVGLLCSPFAVFFLRRKDFDRSRTIILAVVSPAVAGLTLLLGTSELFWGKPAFVYLYLLAGSTVAFLVTAALIWWQLPDVFEELGVCRTCGYDLRASLDAGRCPECGTAFDRREVMNGAE